MAYSAYADVLAVRGDLVGAIEAQQKMIELDPDSIPGAMDIVFFYAGIGAFEEAEAVHRSMEERFADHGLTRAGGAVIALARGEESSIRSAMAAGLENELSVYSAWVIGLTAMLGGEFDLAYEAFRRVSPDRLESQEITPEFITWWRGGLCALSWVSLETEGNEAFGQKVLEAAIQLYESGFHEGIRHIERYDWDLCYLLAGENDKALDVLERQLDNNFTGNWPWYLRTPPYDAIRNEPRFIAMQSEFDRRMAEQRDKLRARENRKPAFEF
jgi:tetratricopeptide (TPR) repeat protein